jgi:uncharacterized protein (DUF1697 family)
MAATHLALLRGVNVGGKNKLPMKDLAAMFEDAGCTSVRTFIQSGNVVFTARANIAARLPAVMVSSISERFGFRAPVILRTAESLRQIVAGNPFLPGAAPGPAEDSLHVMFLADTPSPASVAALDPNRSSPDAFIVRGPDIYLQLPNGAARTKLSNAWFDSKLKTISTGRNWRTVTKLLEMMEAKA